jgi:hypothetical protein
MAGSFGGESVEGVERVGDCMMTFSVVLGCSMIPNAIANTSIAAIAGIQGDLRFGFTASAIWWSLI